MGKEVLNAEQKAQVIAWAKLGRNMQEVAAHFGVHKGVIQRLVAIARNELTPQQRRKIATAKRRSETVNSTGESK